MARQWKPDVLHAHSPVLDGLAALRVGKRLGIPVIYEIRAFWEDASVGNGTGREGSLRYWLTRQLETHAAKSADAVAVICEGLRGDLIARGIDADKITVSPNGVDLELFGDPPPRDNSLADTLGIAADDAVIGYIGSFYDYEGIDDLIAAMPALVAVQPRTRMLVVIGVALGVGAAVSVAGAISFVGPLPDFAEDALEEGPVEVRCVGEREVEIFREPVGLEPAFLETGAALEHPAAADVGMGVDAGQHPAEDIVLLDDVREQR